EHAPTTKNTSMGARMANLPQDESTSWTRPSYPIPCLMSTQIRMTLSPICAETAYFTLAILTSLRSGNRSYVPIPDAGLPAARRINSRSRRGRATANASSHSIWRLSPRHHRRRIHHSHLRHHLPISLCPASDMGRQHGVREADQLRMHHRLALEDIKARAPQPLRLERFHEG